MDRFKSSALLFLSAFSIAPGQWISPFFPDPAKVNAMAAAGPMIYAGTDAGLYVSGDEGRTWRFGPAPRVKIGSLEGLGDFILAGTEQELYRAGKDGKWDRIARGGSIPFPWMRKLGKTLAASNWDGLWVSRDSGLNWRSAPVSLGSVRTHALCASPQGSVFAFGDYGFQYLSSDSGAGWEARPSVWAEQVWAIRATFSSDGSQVFYSMGDGTVRRSPGNASVFTAPPNTGMEALGVIGNYLLVGYLGGMSRSGDQGASFQTVGQGLGSGWTLQIAAGSCSVFARQSDGLYRSQDSGRTWKKLLPGGPYPLCLAARGREVYVPLENRLYHSRDEGESWSWAEGAVHHEFGGERNFMAITSQGLVHLAGNNSLWFTRDQGRTWDSLIGYTGSDGVRAMAVVGDRIFAGLESGLLASDDFGKTWFDPDSALPAAPFTAVVSRGREIYAAGGAAIYRSGDSGETWSRMTQGGAMGSRAAYSLALSGDTLYAGTEAGGSGTTGLYFSRGPGAPWLPADPTGDVPAIGALLPRPGRILAGRPDGPMAAFSLDTKTWSPIGPETAVNVIGFHQAPSRLLAFSQGQGIFASEDGGLTWNPSAKGLAGYQVLSLAGLDGLYVGTARDGLFRHGGSADWTQGDPVLADRPIHSLVPDGEFLFGIVDGGDIARIARGNAPPRVTRLPGSARSPHGLAVEGGTLYLATDSGLFSALLPGPAADFAWQRTRPGGYSAVAVRGSEMALLGGRSLYLSRDGGKTFPDTLQAPDNRGSVNPMGFTAAGDLIIATLWGIQIVRSADRKVSRPFESGTVYSLANRGGTWALASSAGVYVSVEGGPWRPLPSAPKPAYAVAFSGDTLYAGSDALVKALRIDSAALGVGKGRVSGNPEGAVQVSGFASPAGYGIRYSVPSACRLTLTLAALDGRSVRIFSGLQVKAGRHVARLPPVRGLRGPLRYILETETGPGAGGGKISRRSGWITLP